jgi:transposase InsO family protein
LVIKPKPKKKRRLKKYHTPEKLGEKIQIDVKYVPRECNANPMDDYRYYQYTAINEASRERFIYFYREISSYSSVDFLRRMIRHFGYVPRIVQTDNGHSVISRKQRECIRLTESVKGLESFIRQSSQELRGITAKWKEAIEPTMNVL